MQSKNRKELFTRFQKAMRKDLPEYEVLTRGKKEAGGGVIYADGDKLVRAFVFVQPHDNNDTFTVEVAGSKNGMFPWSNIPDEFAWPAELPQVFKTAPLGRFRMRLSCFGEPIEDIWWPTSSFVEPDMDDDEAWDDFIFSDEPDVGIDEGIIAASISDVVERLSTHWLPYVNSVRSAMES